MKKKRVSKGSGMIVMAEHKWLGLRIPIRTHDKNYYCGDQLCCWGPAGLIPKKLR